MNVPDANGLLMFVAKFVLWPEKDNSHSEKIVYPTMVST